MGKFGLKKSKLPVLSENWHIWYLKDDDSYSNINFLKFWPQNWFLGKFGQKKVKLSVLSVWKLAHMVSGECRFLFQHLLYEFQTMNQFLGKLLGKFGPKKSNLFILPENWRTLYLEDADSFSEISFLNFET